VFVVHVDFVNMTAHHRHRGKFQVSMVALLLLCPQFCFAIVRRDKHFMGLRCIQTLASEMLNMCLLFVVPDVLSFPFNNS
jgi:hypothetical protein